MSWPQSSKPNPFAPGPKKLANLEAALGPRPTARSSGQFSPRQDASAVLSQLSDDELLGALVRRFPGAKLSLLGDGSLRLLLRLAPVRQPTTHRDDAHGPGPSPSPRKTTR